MISAHLWKVDRGGWRCSNPDCKHSPKYHYNIIGKVWDLKLDTTCVIITCNSGTEQYCRDCVDIIYPLLKSVLDTKL